MSDWKPMPYTGNKPEFIMPKNSDIVNHGWRGWFGLAVVVVALLVVVLIAWALVSLLVGVVTTPTAERGAIMLWFMR